MRLSDVILLAVREVFNEITMSIPQGDWCSSALYFDSNPNLYLLRKPSCSDNNDLLYVGSSETAFVVRLGGYAMPSSGQQTNQKIHDYCVAHPDTGLSLILFNKSAQVDIKLIETCVFYWLVMEMKFQKFAGNVSRVHSSYPPMLLNENAPKTDTYLQELFGNNPGRTLEESVKILRNGLSYCRGTDRTGDGRKKDNI